jgi:hypothetical protein
MLCSPSINCLRSYKINSELENSKLKKLQNILSALPLNRQKKINARAAKLAVQLRVQPFQLPQ